MMNGRHYITLIFLAALIAGSTLTVNAQEWDKMLSLNGYWKFSIGTNPEWKKPGYNDSDWEELKVPSSWEDEGFHGYNGYAWYRIHFKLPFDPTGKQLYLHMGIIDDADEVYVNGILIGYSGKFPPEYSSAYYHYRQYPLPSELLNRGMDNVIAVKVYDAELSGGIMNGDLGIFIRKNTLRPDLSLEGIWKFKTGDDKDLWAAEEERGLTRKDIGYNDSGWEYITVPGRWDQQGYSEYDGYAWYRKSFIVPENLINKQLVLLMGRIDDLDEVYLNGELVGSTGKMRRNPDEIRFNNEYMKFRGYYLPTDLLKEGYNTIAVRVYDGFKDGGIYMGPIGLITKDKYTRFWKERKKNEKGFWEKLFE